MLKILNLYACLGGNRYKWNDSSFEITSVELDPGLAELYSKRFPNDKIIISDAHQYLLDHYKEFDFIWSSPPCPSHSRARHARKNNKDYKPIYPEMSLYQEVIFLETHFDGKYCVENVIPYYEPLIPGQKRGRHIYWTNFKLPNNLNERECNLIGGKNELINLCNFHEIDLREYKGDQRKDKIARNLVDYQAGLTILNTALGIINENIKIEKTLFD